MSAAPLFDVAERMILTPSGLDESRLSAVLGTVMSRGVDYADLYFQLSREESWALEDGIVKEGSHSIEQGVGVRAISGEKTGFAYTDEVLLPALVEASDAARAIARSGASQGTCQSIDARKSSSAEELPTPFSMTEFRPHSMAPALSRLLPIQSAWTSFRAAT